MSRLYPILALLVLFSSGCERASDTGQDDSGPESLYFEAVGAGQAGRLSDTTEVVLRTPDEWIALKDSLRMVAPIPEVDFSQTMLLVAALPQNSGGFRVQFESVEKAGDEILASYVVFAPGSDCLTIMALTLPFQAVAVRKADGEVTFRRRVELESCALD